MKQMVSEIKHAAFVLLFPPSSHILDDTASCSQCAV